MLLLLVLSTCIVQSVTACGSGHHRHLAIKLNEARVSAMNPGDGAAEIKDLSEVEKWSRNTLFSSPVLSSPLSLVARRVGRPITVQDSYRTEQSRAEQRDVNATGRQFVPDVVDIDDKKTYASGLPYFSNYECCSIISHRAPPLISSSRVRTRKL